MPPPASPIDVDERVMRANEQILGIHFPPDYVAFSRVYGSGTIDVGNYWWKVESAAGPKLPHFILHYLCTRGGSRSRGFGEKLPFGLFPERDGLLPFGYCDTDYFTWLVDGEPSTWKVVLNWSWADDAYAIFDMGFVEFWVKALSLQIEIPGYECDWNPATDISFRPDLYG